MVCHPLVLYFVTKMGMAREGGGGGGLIFTRFVSEWITRFNWNNGHCIWYHFERIN